MTKETNHLISENDMEEFASQLADIIGREAILAIDIFSVSKYLKERTISYNYGLPVYIDKILPGFLSEKGSIGLVDEEMDKPAVFSAKRIRKAFKKPLKYKHIEDYKFAGKCEFKDYIDYLVEHEFGVYCLWVNNFILEEDAKTNVSVLLVLDVVPNEQQLERLRTLTYKKVFTKGFRITVKEFMAMYREVADQERVLKALEADKQHFGHTIQNIFPKGLSNVNSALELTDENSDVHKLLLLAKKDLTISKVIFQSISEQEIKELSQKCILDFLTFLRDHTTSRHTIELDLEPGRMYNFYIVPYNEIGNTLLVLWNFFHNAVKYCGNQEANDSETVYIKAFNQKGKLAILFKNAGSKFIKPQTKEFLQGESDRPDPVDEKGGKGGLEIAKRRLKDLNWNISFPSNQNEFIKELDVHGVKMKRKYYSTEVLLTTHILRL